MTTSSLSEIMRKSAHTELKELKEQMKDCSESCKYNWYL